MSKGNISDSDAYLNMRKIRRELHKMPELSGCEFNTRKYIKKYVEDNLSNIKVIFNNEDGLIAKYEGIVSNATIAFRAELDALPINETRNVDYASRVPGISHACGHDVHMAILLGIMEYINSKSSELNFIFIFQSSEEIHGGAKKLSSYLKNLNINWIYALHITDNLPAGYFSFNDGLMLAANYTIDMRVKLNQGHISESNDLLGLLNLFIEFQQEYNNREKIFKITKVESNGYYNVTSDTVSLYLSFRGKSIEILEEDFKKLLLKLKKFVNSDEKIEYKVISKYPELINDKQLNNFTRKLISKCVKGSTAIDCPFLLSSDDFSFYGKILKEAKTLYFFIGAYLDENVKVHKENFDVNEECLYFGYKGYKVLVDNVEKMMKNA